MLLTILAIFVLGLGAFGALFWVLVRRAGAGDFDPLEWLEDFSADDYRPMERLLDDRDYAFLASQPGYEPAIARRLRRQRIGIFQAYLRGMFRDFHRLLGKARFTMFYATEDQSALGSALLRLRLRFYASVIAVEVRVALNMVGLGAVIGPVDTRGLTAALDRMQSYMLRFMLVEQSS